MQTFCLLYESWLQAIFCGHPAFVVCSCLEYYSEVIAILQMFSMPLCCCVVAERVGETFGPAPLVGRNLRLTPRALVPCIHKP